MFANPRLAAATIASAVLLAACAASNSRQTTAAALTAILATDTRSQENRARDVYLTTASDGFFGDNYFDLLPGETRTLSFKPAAPTTLQSIQTSLRATTIADTY